MTPTEVAVIGITFLTLLALAFAGTAYILILSEAYR